VLGVHPEARLVVGLDPLVYSPLPMGISVEFKDEYVVEASQRGWHAWERETRPGVRRGEARAPEGLETLVAFRPERLLEYARLERQAHDLGLDPPLRLRAAERAFTAAAETTTGTLHELEHLFQLSHSEILDLITRRFRLKVAVAGGVAERHLADALDRDPAVRSVAEIDQDGEPDFQVRIGKRRRVRVECKNVSPTRYANGDLRVEVQKTRASKGDPASRFYPVRHFDALAACTFAATGAWEFRFQRSSRLARHREHPDRIAPMQRVDDSWAHSLKELYDV
jgi:hypothetical protein